MRILAVCLGNICRSPTAEAALREALREAGLEDQVEVDSAGTGTWHLGDPPDARMTAAAAEAGLTLSGTARRIGARDVADADLVLVMDRRNLRDVRALADAADHHKVVLFRGYDPGADGDEVPDPYMGGPEGFAVVVEMARAAARGVVGALRTPAG
jgi:protein-tyrosine phosphatase